MVRRLSSTKRKNVNNVFIVDRVWDRKVDDEDGSFRYLTSWRGYAEKTWEPIDHFTEEAKSLVRELEAILDDPDSNPKPDWLLDYENQKARGLDVIKRTPGYKKRAGRKADIIMREIKREIKEEIKDEPDEEPFDDSEKREDGPSTSAVIPEEQQPQLSLEIPEQMPTTRGLISPPTITSPNGNSLMSPSNVFADNLFDAAGILLPLEGEIFTIEPFNWFNYLATTGSEAAIKECFWKRTTGKKFENPFGKYIGKVLKIPDFDEDFSPEWCTIGTVTAVHGPWVQVHALDTDPALSCWLMADDACLQPFTSLSDPTMPKCKEPINRRSTGVYKRIIDRALDAKKGGDNRVPAECFKDQLPWKNRPIRNYFQVGNKLETYDPERGEGCFYPATVVDVNAFKDVIKVHYDGYPDSQTKQVKYNDPRLFPCGFASAIGWHCVLPLDRITIKMPGTRGRSKRTTYNNPTVAVDSIQGTPTIVGVDLAGREHVDTVKASDYYASLNPTQVHHVRAPAIPGLTKPAEQPKKERAKRVAVRRNTQPKKEIKEEEEEAPPPRQMTPLRMEDFEEKVKYEDSNDIPRTEVRFKHTGHKIKVILNHNCKNGDNIHPEAFRHIRSLMEGSLVHVYREILQQLMNAAIDNRKFADCLPRTPMHPNKCALGITYDDCINSMVCILILPPPNLPYARKAMAGILQKAGMCPNSVCFETRIICQRCKDPEPEESELEQQLLQQQQFRARYQMNRQNLAQQPRPGHHHRQVQAQQLQTVARGQPLPRHIQSQQVPLHASQHRHQSPQQQVQHQLQRHQSPQQQGQQMYRIEQPSTSSRPSSSNAPTVIVPNTQRVFARPISATTGQYLTQQQPMPRPGPSSGAVPLGQQNGQHSFMRGTSFTFVAPTMSAPRPPAQPNQPQDRQDRQDRPPPSNGGRPTPY